ncbi:GTP cyclohydrolase 1 type 2/Nif3 [Amylostereum chailletii]|nr:GTP cyclohydrolase 1 type 2/Nif3 [Amylostereum chailletii]
MTAFKLVFFCPRADTRTVLDALFATLPQALGRIGNYHHCAFIIEGTGQFIPGEGANPVVGDVGVLELVNEHRVEIRVQDRSEERAELRKVVEELKKVHPYEEVAYDIYRLEDL